MHTEKNINIEIEALRCVSICLVLVAHWPLLSPRVDEKITWMFKYLSFGVGVDLFFCISGYVVSRSYMEALSRLMDKESYWTAAGSFWLRRCFRLLPSAWLWVMIGIFCSLFFNQSGVFMNLQQNLKSAISIFTLTANISHMYGGLVPNNVYWSLSLEEQFYLLFPLMLLLVRDNRKRILLLSLLVAVQFPIRRNFFGSLTDQYFASFRTDGFAWGILVFMFSRSGFYRRVQPGFLTKARPIAFLLTVLLIYFLTAIPARYYQYAWSMGLMAVIAALIVWLSSYGKCYIFGYEALSRAMRWIGSRSYAIYLIHLPAFKIINEITFKFQKDAILIPESLSPYLLLVGSLSLILALAEINFRMIEAPLRKKGTEIASRRFSNLEAL